MDALSILGAASGIKASLDLAKAVAELAIDTRIAGQLNQLVQQISAAHTEVLQAKTEQGELLQRKHDLEQRVRELQTQLAEREDFRARMERYRLVEASPGCLLYQTKPECNDEPQHYICPNCAEQRRISRLQLHADNLRLIEYFCAACEKPFYGEANPHYEERRTRVLPDARFSTPRVLTKKPR